LKELKANSPLIEGVSQYEVDFVIPLVGVDLPLGIDPFLLFKSRDPSLSKLHEIILSAFNQGIEMLLKGNTKEAEHLFAFPEVAEIGLGYAKKGKKGSGLGQFLSALIIETLKESPALLERGVRHIEEMQLVSLGIGPDRISDIAGNLLKEFLIEYTQDQSRLWGLPLVAGAPVEHIFDLKTYSWYDDYSDLPVSPIDGTPILLVPRRLVRTLPWINYDDFFRMEFSTYLRAKRVRGIVTKKASSLNASIVGKEKVVSVARKEVERIDRYVSAKEASAAGAQPTLDYLDLQQICPEAESLKDRLREVLTGAKEASVYQRLVLEILNYLFNPELIDGQLEVRTIDGTERRDIIFTNDSDNSFWDYLRTEHSGIFLMFETKNTQAIEMEHLNQTATYLGDRIGYVAFIATRYPIEEAQQRKIFSIYNDSSPNRKIILAFSDSDLEKMLDMKCVGEEPMRHVQKLYRTFRTSVQ